MTASDDIYPVGMPIRTLYNGKKLMHSDKLCLWIYSFLVLYKLEQVEGTQDVLLATN